MFCVSSPRCHGLDCIVWLWHFLIILTFSYDFLQFIFFKSTQRVPPAGLCCKLARLIYHGHHATLIETQSSTSAMWLLMIIKLLVCAYCPYNFINVEDRSWMNKFFNDLIFISHKNGKRYKLLFFCLKMVNLWLSFFEVFISNFNILSVLSQLSLQITMPYRETLLFCIPKYF